jgi:hypothetical protein
MILIPRPSPAEPMILYLLAPILNAPIPERAHFGAFRT